MEFLMTYGWAILVVLAAIGALAYFGILSPSKFLPDSYTMSGGISAGEYKMDDNGTLTLGFINNMGVSINITQINVTTTGGSAFTCSDLNTNYVWLDNGEEATRGFTCAGVTVGQKMKAEIKATYIKSGESVSHTASGSLTTVVEE